MLPHAGSSRAGHGTRVPCLGRRVLSLSLQGSPDYFLSINSSVGVRGVNVNMNPQQPSHLCRNCSHSRYSEPGNLDPTIRALLSDLSKQQHPGSPIEGSALLSCHWVSFGSARQSFDSELWFHGLLTVTRIPGVRGHCLNFDTLCLLGVNRRAHGLTFGRELEATLGLAGQFTHAPNSFAL